MVLPRKDKNMSHMVLDRIPARGITKEEHDAFVRMTGRNYTDQYLLPHLGSHAPEGGTVPARSIGLGRRDPKTHAPSVH